MPSKFNIKHFEPVHLKHANKKLDMHIDSAHLDKETKDAYKKGILKESLWKKLVGLFK